MKKSAGRWYICPEVIIVDFEVSENLLAGSMLENPVNGDEWGWK